MKRNKLMMIGISSILAVSTLALVGCSSSENTPKQAKESILHITPKVAANYTAFLSSHRAPDNLNCLNPRIKSLIGKPAGITQDDYNKMQKTCAPYYQELSAYLATQGISGVTPTILTGAHVQRVIQEKNSMAEENKLLGKS